MAKGQKHDSPESVKEELAKAEKQKKYYERQLKVLQKGVAPQLTRAARTNRLCTRAGMLESFLSYPELLTNDQVMELLKIAFRQEAVQDALSEMLKSAVPEEMQKDP